MNRSSVTDASADYPNLSSSYPISDAQVKQFQTDGFIVLKSVLSSEEIAAYSKAIYRDGMHYFESAGMQTVFSGSLLQKLNFRFESEAMRTYCLSARLGAIGARLTHSKAVRLYHEQLLFKPPGGAPSYWHQDQYFWPIETTQALGTWMPLTDISETMGALRFVRSSHKLGDLGQHDIEASSEEFFNSVIKKHRFEIIQVKSMKAGDMTVHNGWTIHGAPGNQSDRMRAAVVVTMFPDGTRVGKLSNKYRKSDRDQFLGGRDVGSIANSEFNTILYSK